MNEILLTIKDLATVVQKSGTIVENIEGRLSNQQKEIDLMSIENMAQRKVNTKLIELILEVAQSCNCNQLEVQNKIDSIKK